MNQKPIKDVEEVEKDEGSGMDEFIATILFVLVLPLALAKYVTPRWAARPEVWRIKELKTDIRKAIAWAVPLNLLAVVITWDEVKTPNWIFTCFGIIVLWISMGPGVLAIASYELSVVRTFSPRSFCGDLG